MITLVGGRNSALLTEDVTMGNYPRLDQWRLWQQAQGHSRRTINERVRLIRVFSDTTGTMPATATTEDVVAFLAGLDVRPGTRATYYSYLRAWFLWLVRMGHRDDDPCIRMKAPKTPRRKPRPLTDDELFRVFSTRMHRRTLMMVMLAAFQGLRVSEIAKIKGQDVDIRGGQLRIVGKGEVDRTLPLHPLVAAFAIDFPTRGHWFTTHVGNVDRQTGPILGRSVSNIVSRLMDRAEITGGAHRLRHTYATRLLRNGVDIRIVQELLRHASLATTQIYTEVTYEQQRAGIDTLAMPAAPRAVEAA